MTATFDETYPYQPTRHRVKSGNGDYTADLFWDRLEGGLGHLRIGTQPSRRAALQRVGLRQVVIVPSCSPRPRAEWMPGSPLERGR